MSTDLHSTRLLWQGARGGVAKLHGRLVRLAAPPDLGMRYVAVDYIPEMGLRQIMPYGCGWRDMFDAEVAAADAALAALTRQAADGWAIGTVPGPR